MSEPINISFRIKNISTLEFSIRNIQLDQTFDKDQFPIQISLGTQIDPLNKFISVDTFVNIFADPENKNKICGLTTRVVYEVENLQSTVVVEGNNIKIPESFMTTLISIALSTTRGILTAKTEGTLLHDVFMPIVNPTSFKPTDK
ncbi:MAG: hypothetical protein Q8Q47_02855 [Ignavibacteriaceae bacterium]|nr:hypothetical protein [Ignavibacteriaceae bacterium]